MSIRRMAIIALGFAAVGLLAYAARQLSPETSGAVLVANASTDTVSSAISEVKCDPGDAAISVINEVDVHGIASGAVTGPVTAREAVREYIQLQGYGLDVAQFIQRSVSSEKATVEDSSGPKVVFHVGRYGTTWVVTGLEACSAHLRGLSGVRGF